MQIYKNFREIEVLQEVRDLKLEVRGYANKKIRENLWAICVRFFTATDLHKFSRIIIAIA